MTIKQTFAAAILLPVFAIGQSTKVQTAYRNISDYKSSKDVSSLMKAKEAIDLASNHEDTKEKAKTWVYRAEIYYYLFKNNLAGEEKKLSNITDKNEKLTMAYGNVSTAEYEEAGKSMEKAAKIDSKDHAYDMEIAQLGMMMIQDVNNLAVGKFKAGKYEESAEYFEANYEMYKMMNKKDTNIIMNSLIASQKAQKPEMVIKYAQKMIDDKVADGYTYGSLLDAYLSQKDTASAEKVLQNGRKAFPHDIYLMNRETEFFLSRGKNKEALDNLNTAIEKDPSNAQLIFVRGNLFDRTANPKDASGKDMEKPKNYDELMGKAEKDYLSAFEKMKDNADVWYSLGGLYNNWGGVWQKRSEAEIKDKAKIKEYDTKSMENFNKAIPYLEKYVEMRPDEKPVMQVLMKLFLITGQPEKAAKIKEQLKK